MPPSASFLSVEPEDILATVVKPAEDGDGWVLRAVETARRVAEALICLPGLGREFRARFRPAEIKTFFIPREAGQPVVETNLLEWTE